MDILFSSTTELAAAIQAGRVSAREALEVHQSQIEKHNPALNAIVTLDIDRARERARAADEALAHGDLWGPLHGVPFTLKDAHATAGMRTTSGFPPLAGQLPQEDGTTSARLKAAGGILIGKTNVPALLADFQTGNPLFGRTNNPWDLERTPGGSSGGAAAALAAGMTAFEIGTDLSGSIRIPAHFCGLYGLKPTEHRVSLDGLLPGLPPSRSLRIMSTIGPLARSAQDLELLYRVIAGPDGRDTNVPPVPLQAAPQLELKRLRVALAANFPGFPLAAEVRQAVEGLASQLEQLGALVEQPALPDLDFSQDLASAGELVEALIGAFQSLAGEQTEPPVTLAYYLTALERRDRSILAWERFFEQWDLLLCPPCMTTAFPHCQPGAPLPVDGQAVSYWMLSAHCMLFNYTGHPAIVIPAGLDQVGLPLGVQLVGKRWGEAGLLAAARALSQLTGGFQRPPGY